MKYANVMMVTLLMLVLVTPAFAFKIPTILSPTSGATISGTVRYNVSFEVEPAYITQTFNLSIFSGASGLLCRNQSPTTVVNNTNFTITCAFSTTALVDNASRPFQINITNSTGQIVNATISQSQAIDNTNPSSANFTFTSPMTSASVITAAVGSEVTSCSICFGSADMCFAGTIGASQCSYTPTLNNPIDRSYNLFALLSDGVDSQVEANNGETIIVNLQTAGPSSDVVGAYNQEVAQKQVAAGATPYGSSTGSGTSSNTWLIVGVLGLVGWFVFFKK